MEAHEGCCMFSSITTTEDFSEVFPTSSDDPSLAMLTSEDYSLDLGAFETIVDNSLGWDYEDSLHLSSQQQSSHEDMRISKEVFIPPLLFPGVDTELDQELSIFHLLKAYGEAIERESVELARVITSRLREKASPVGTTMERLVHHLLFQGSEPQSEFLKQESIKNYAPAFRAFYEITPYGRFPHFVANTAILESVPSDVDAVHIVDFDVGEGIQWPPLLAALGPQRSVRITCMNFREDCKVGLPWSFKRTKERLSSFSRTLGLDVKVDEMGAEELLLEKRRSKEWLVFNCMVGLPHMGMANKSGTTGTSQVVEFTRLAQELIASSRKRGILTYGNGPGVEMRPFSDGHLLHSHGLFESMEWHFPSHLSLARTAMECLFVGPCVSSSPGWLGGEEGCGHPLGSGVEVWRLSMQNLLEAKEMVGGGDQYGVKVGDGGNEMVLEWKGTPLVRVCAWR